MIELNPKKKERGDTTGQVNKSTRPYENYKHLFLSFYKYILSPYERMLLFSVQTAITKYLYILERQT